jgi:acyl carrier protein
VAAAAPHDDINATMTGLVAAEFGVPASELSPDLDLTSVNGADSVKVLRIIARIERTYDIELEDDQVFGFKTIRDVSEAVAAAIAERGVQ